MAFNGRRLRSVTGGTRILVFLVPRDCWCCVSPCFLSPPVFSALCFHRCFPRNSRKLLSSPRSLHTQCRNGARATPGLAGQESSAPRVTQTLPYLFSSACYRCGCFASVGSFRFLLLLLSSDFSVCPCQAQDWLPVAEFGASRSSRADSSLC